MKSGAYGWTGGVRVLSAALALAVLHGCASAPVPASLSAEAKAQLGIVGLASARFPPTVEFLTPAKGTLPAAGRKAVRWAGKAGGAVAEAGKGLGSAGGGGFGAAAVFLVWLGALAASTAGGAAVGAVAGAVTAVPADTVRQAEAALAGAWSSLNAQEELRARVLRLAQQGSLHEVVALAAGPSSPDDRLEYGWVTIEGVDSVLEISLLTVELAGEWDVDPPVALTLSGGTRVVRVRDGAEIHRAPLRYVAGTRRFAEWAADEARLFREDLDRALDALAELIAERYFEPGWGYQRFKIPEE